MGRKIELAVDQESQKVTLGSFLEFSLFIAKARIQERSNGHTE